MSAPTPEIGPLQLGLGLVFILGAGLTSLAHGLKLGRDLAVGTVRAFAQLFLMGYVLVLVFELQNPWITLGLFAAMTVFATNIVTSRLKNRAVPVAWTVFLTMLASYVPVSALVTGVIIGASPWWRPEIFIPISGMVVGNSMTALAVCLERLFADLKARRAEIEARLCLGADPAEAGAETVKRAMTAGMIPSISSMMGVGLVFLPGMMTGQILAGQDPRQAVRYQIVVMLMLVGSTALGSLVVVRLVARRAFGQAWNLASMSSTGPNNGPGQKTSRQR